MQLIRLLITGVSLLIAGAVPAAPLTVLVSLLPQKYFAERIGGEHVAVSVLVGPGRSPENYEPTMQQMSRLGATRLFWRMGLPFEEVLTQRLFADKSTLTLLDAREGLTLRSMENLAIVLDVDEGNEAGHDLDHHHDHEGLDPHIWLNPHNVKHMGELFMNALVHLDPGHAESYQRNYQHFIQELEQLDQDIRALLDGLEQHRFMVFHPAWGYFADAYGLRQIPIEIEGKSPGPKTLAAIIQLAREEQIKVIFVQQQFSQRDAQTVAKAMHGAVVAVDPLAENYPANLLAVARAFAEAMR